MNSMLEALREKRLTIGDLANLETKHIVVLGLFESSRYRSKIMQWLPSMDFGDSTLVAIDNNSSDDTWTWLQDLFRSQVLNCKFFLIRNQMNYGGYGTLTSNLDLLKKAEWITTLHQDDHYEPSHITSHSSAISNASESVGIVSSESVSVDDKGKKLGYPKAAWLLGKEASSVDVFLAHLKLHSLPFSGASFRSDLLEQYAIPWHSNAFPDTELVMRAASKWTYIYLEEPKVKYFENPVSESHLLSENHRSFGAYFALVRVFRDTSFFSLCRQVDQSQLESFTRAIHDGIFVRIKNPDLRQSLQVIAQEAIIESIGPNKFSSRILAQFYSSIGDNQATQFLNNLAGRSNSALETEPESTLPDLKQPNIPLKVVFLKVTGSLPQAVLKTIFVAIMKTKIGKNFFPNWNFTWKKK